MIIYIHSLFSLFFFIRDSKKSMPFTCNSLESMEIVKVLEPLAVLQYNFFLYIYSDFCYPHTFIGRFKIILHVTIVCV